MSALPSIIFYTIPLIISAGLALSSWRRRTREARPFCYLMIAIAIWSLFHTLSVADPTVDGTLLWAQVQYIGIAAVGPCWLWFALAYANRWDRVRRPARVLLFIPSALSLAAVLTNQWHQLWWTSVTRDLSRPFVAIAVTRGPLFWIHTSYTYAYILLGLGLFIYAMLGARLMYHNQARLVITGALFPVVGNIAHLLGLQIPAIDDPTPFLFSASGLFLYLAMRNFRLLDLSPIAQREVFEDMPDGMLVLDQQGAIATINPAAARMLEIVPDEWLGRPAGELAGRSALAAALGGLLEPDATSATLVVSYGGGAPRVAEARRRPLIRNQTNTGVLLLLRDMTESAAMQQQLARRIAELTLISQIASTANATSQTADLLPAIADEIIATVAWDRILIGTLQPDRVTMRVVIDQVSHTAETYAGAYVAAPQFGPIFEILAAGETRILKRADPALAETQTGSAMHELGLDTMLVVPLYQRREPLGVLAVGYRSTQTIAAADMQLYQTVGQLIADAITRARLYDAANEASALKSAFLATVSHELRTPLTSIIGYADMLEHGVFGPLPERTVEPLEHVRHSGQMLLRMINDILDFSKMESGHFTIERYPVDLSTVIRSVAGTLRPQAYQRGLTLDLSLAPDLPLVYANSSRLEQVLTNLLANAIKFTERGTITVSTSFAEGRVRLSVRDTGIGIAPDDLKQLFQPFQQLDNQLTRRYGGSGLGLAISKRLIELMDGALLVSSVPGVGTTFTCELRANPVEAPREAVMAD